MINDDTCRCMDETCKKKDTCSRFLQRHDEGYISITETLREGEKCDFYIKEKPLN